ncbi:unnamed protein product [Didymodactylos carnosus]|uniref:NAD(P)(+)--arginine ADP-ribosyltransferase n=1 Tax=Didymodactylos carnosus TaxID=1234261 RepID=A0A814YQP1_9BILA|nr:unnamed protein product [Didymodactylos carnosus]CAF3995439.1 unnamed protein product [Didymodactylos carnosus]
MMLSQDAQQQPFAPLVYYVEGSLQSAQSDRHVDYDRLHPYHHDAGVQSYYYLPDNLYVMNDPQYKAFYDLYDSARMSKIFCATDPFGRLHLDSIVNTLKQYFSISVTEKELFDMAQQLHYDLYKPLSARRTIRILVELGKMSSSTEYRPTPSPSFSDAKGGGKMGLSLPSENTVRSNVLQMLLPKPHLELVRAIPEEVYINNDNKEDVTLIYYDENISSDDDTTKMSDILKRINNYVLVCSDRKTCLKYIEETLNEKIFLILSGESATNDDLLDEIHDKKQIDSIYIFCIKRQSYEALLTNSKYSKIIDIYTDYNRLLKNIKENMQFVVKQSTAFTLVHQDEKAMRNLNKEGYEFGFFFLMKLILLKMKSTPAARADMIDVCRNYYRGNKQELETIKQFESTYSSDDAIKWYTKQTFVYRLVNKALRTEDFESLYTFRFFISDLCSNLATKFEGLKLRQKKPPVLTSYRGLKLSLQEIYNLKINIGQKVSTNGFLSTTRSRDVAYSFAQKSTKRVDVQAVMFEIEADTKLLTTPIADIAEYSDYPEEEELLFDLCAQFSINSVDYIENEQYWSVKLTALEELLTSDIRKSLEKQMLNINLDIELGKILNQKGEYDKCEKYFENLLRLNQYRPEELGQIYSYLGDASLRQTKYEIALKYFSYAYNQHINKTKPPNILLAAYITDCIGTVYFLQRDFEKALEHYTKAYKVRKQIIPENNCAMAESLNNFGVIYEEKNDNKHALDHYLKSLKLYENCHACVSHDDDMARGYTNIGCIYFKEEKYDKSIEYHWNAVRIREQQFLLPQFQDIFRSLKCLWEIYNKKNDDDGKTLCNEKLYNACEKVINAKTILHENTKLAVRKALAEEDYSKENYNNTLDHLYKILKIYEKIEPDNHEKIAELCESIGLAHCQNCEYDWSIEYFKKSLGLHEKHLPEHYKDVADCQYNIGFAHMGKGEFNLALDFVKKSLKTREQNLPSLINIDLANCYFNIGVIKHQYRKYDDAIGYGLKGLTIYEKVLSQNNLEIAERYRTLHSWYIQKGDFEQAYQCLLKVLNIYEMNLPDQRENYAQCLWDIGSFLFDYIGEFDKALDYTTKSLNIRQALLSTDGDNIDIAKCYIVMGVIHYNKLHYQLSLEYLMKALTIYQKHVTDSNKEVTAIIYYCLSECYCKLENYVLALENGIKALQIQENVLSAVHENIAQSHSNIATIYAKKKDYNKAIAYCTKAVTILNQLIPSESHEIAYTLENIGNAYSDMNQDNLALEFYSKSVEMYRKTQTIKHPCVLRVENMIHSIKKKQRRR